MLGGSGNIINLNVQPLQTGTGNIIAMHCTIAFRYIQSVKLCIPPLISVFNNHLNNALHHCFSYYTIKGLYRGAKICLSFNNLLLTNALSLLVACLHKS